MHQHLFLRAGPETLNLFLPVAALSMLPWGQEVWAGVNEQLSCKRAKSLNDQYKGKVQKQGKCLAWCFTTRSRVNLPYL